MRRAISLPPARATVLLVAVAIALALVVLSLAVAPKRADAATTVVTRTFSNADQITIPAGAPTDTAGAAAPYPSERSVQGFNQGTVLDVDLTLKNFSHTFPRDVDVLLSKVGRTRTVMSDAGGFGPGVSNITLRLNDEAPSALPENTNPAGGQFRPANYGGSDFFPAPTPGVNPTSALSGFDGMNPNGIWKLRVVDDLSGDVGKFAGGWSITIKARVQT
jgi:hypothetical protein